MEECILINRSTNSATSLEFPNIYAASNNPSVNTPSMSLVNFVAYGISSIALHIELYNAVQAKVGQDTVAAAERWLVQQGLRKDNRSLTGGAYFVEDDGSRGHPANETLPTWIRNTLNHPLLDRKMFGDHDLKRSIESMLRLL